MNPSPLTVAAVAMQGDPRSAEKKQPLEVVRALEMLADGHSWSEVQEETGLSHRTITRLKSRHGDTLEARRMQLAEDGFNDVAVLREIKRKKALMLLDDEDALKKTNLKDLVLAEAVQIDKAMQMQDQRMQEERGGGISLKDALEAIEAAKESVRLKLEAKKAEAIDV